MANEVKILISAVDKASATLNKVQSELKQTGQTGQTSFLGMGKAALGAVGGIAAVGAAVFAASKFIKGSIEDWANYNEEIRKLSIATGTAPEDLSRLSQAADDVGVSMGAMETAMRLMSKNGITPSIENIAKLSDDLLAIQDPAERSTEMAKKFGRGWAEIAPFILSGGDAIRKGTAAIDDNLVATSKSIAESRKYKAAVDNLTDTWTGLRNQAGAIVLPIITEGLEDAARGIGIISRSIELSNTADAALKKHVITYDEYVIVMRQVREGAISDAEAIELLKGKIEDSIDPLTKMEMQGRKTNVQIKEMGEKSEVTAEDLEELAGTIDKSAVYAGNLADKAGAAARKVKELGDASDVVIDIGFDFKIPDLTGMIENVFDKQKWEAAGGAALEAAFNQVGPALIAGQITQTEANQFFNMIYVETEQIKVALGEITAEEAAQNVADTLGVSLETALGLVNEIRRRAQFAIESRLTIVVDYVTGTGPGGGGKTNVELDLIPDNLKAKGGPVMANQVYMVGERGPEIFVPNTSGSIIPNNQIGGGGGGVSIGAINVYAAQGQSTTAIANAVIRKINQSMRAGSRSGLGYTG